MRATATRKPFRIERQATDPNKGGPAAAAAFAAEGDDSNAAERHQAVMAALQSLGAKIDGIGAAGADMPAPVQPQPAGVDMDALRSEIIEAEKLRGELQELSDAIDRTKEEILSLRHSPRGQDKISTAGDALRAVVSDTEGATDGIIQAAETIEEVAGRIAAQHSGQATRELTDALADQVTHIFEHCNFQDITGQRITKVVQTMAFIDERVSRMMEIWGGDSGFAGTQSRGETTAPEGEVLDGPSAAPEMKISQDDIDKMFD